MADRDYSPYQQKIIRRYYDNFDAIQEQRLADLATDLYLAEGKKQDRLWKQVEQILTRVGFAPDRVAHVIAQRNPALLPDIIQELRTRSS